MNLPCRACLSVQNRVIIPYRERHFQCSKGGRRIRNYQNTHSGERCFFIGNGPSLRAADLTKLQENGEVTFAFNRIYNIFDQTKWRPTFYISQDEKMLSGCIKEVCDLQAKEKFIPIQLKWWNGIEIPRAIYFNMRPQNVDDPDRFAFSDDCAREIFNAATCMYTAAQLAAYMGFSEIYLIGVDHHFQISQNNQGEIIVDNSVKDYFTDKYNEDKDKLYIPNTERSTMTYEAMKRHCDARSVRVFNATRGGKLEVFPRVTFDSLFK